MTAASNASAVNGSPRSRHDFSSIPETIPIPDLIEVQRDSYKRFLQADLLPGERDDVGLQAVFNSVFPITDFRGLSKIDFRPPKRPNAKQEPGSYEIGNWQCSCGNLRGLRHLRAICGHEDCRKTVKTDPQGGPQVMCGACNRLTANNVTFCPKCGDPVRMKTEYDEAECRDRGMNYAAPLKVKLWLTVYEKDSGAGEKKKVLQIQDDEVFFGEIPLMTKNGTFIISGTERVVVSQLHRSPGVFFEAGDTSAGRRTYFLGKIIPYRGSWVEFEYDHKNLLHVRIDRKRRFLGTVFLRALGLETDEQILKKFYKADTIRVKGGGKLKRKVSKNLLGARLAGEIKGEIDGVAKVIGKKGRKVNSRLLQQIREAGIKDLPATPADLEGAVFAADVVNKETGDVLGEANGEASAERIAEIIEAGIKTFDLIFPESDECGAVLSETLRKDTVKTQKDALIDIYRKLRPGDPPTPETAVKLFKESFFDPRKYDFSRVGRMKFNIKLKGRQDATSLDQRTLEETDFFDTIRYLLKLRRGIGDVDDIDHLGNRRVRAVGELLENQFRIGLVRMERAMKEKMSVYQELSAAKPQDLVNTKPVMAAVREFFGSSQLSQFMDQTNPLSEITHKRRLSALGPGGLSRERAGFEVRDVHTTHYGRICPIETPEGPNIGLISSLSCYARINRYGFIESPYLKVENGVVVDEVRVTLGGGTAYEPGQVARRAEVEQANKALPEGAAPAQYETHCDYLSAWEEDRYVIAQANIQRDEQGRIVPDFANCRVAGDFQLKRKAEIQYLDVSPKQLVSVATSLIPFLENDDANRALMGSNMQRQAVPLLRADSPIVGTGMEQDAARDSGAVVICKRGGVVDFVDSERIVVRVDSAGHEDQMSSEVFSDPYPLIKFHRSNQNTCINQKPVIRAGDRVDKGQVLADGPCTEQGELALGRNVLAAFMPWRGYNFEDAILVSEKLVKDDYYTSIHVEEFPTEARDTKLGPEEITRDIPNISESFLRNLDESGIIRIGAQVKPGDILVGKVTPKGETQLTPEEKLLRAIFGEKAGDVKDASRYCPPGIEGIVVGADVFSRKGVEKDERAREIEEAAIERLERDRKDVRRILYDERAKRLDALLGGRVVQADLHDEKTNRRLAVKGDELGPDHYYGESGMRARDLKRLKLDGKEPDLDAQIDGIEEMTNRQDWINRKLTDEKIAKLKKGDELPPGVIKTVKVYIAMKRKLSVGDKMAGRHGNKGVIARILPEEDMPFLPDGTPVEVVLNPLGVPSRMNVGQILETHLGWAGRALGVKFASPVFEGPREKSIKSQLEAAGLPPSGKTRLFDGLTGEAFEQDVTVGVMYMLKLSHLVDDKIHARSIGPYSLITQQPLGGKAQFGGQRFGEMEVWALEAYGAAHVLQELLTAKSDDVYGRAKIYESIVKGESAMQPGVPESFNVLIRELQSLCLDVELLKKQQDVIQTALAAD